jgi:hypothetical protein
VGVAKQARELISHPNPLMLRVRQLSRRCLALRAHLAHGDTHVGEALHHSRVVASGVRRCRRDVLAQQLHRRSPNTDGTVRQPPLFPPSPCAISRVEGDEETT